MKIVDVHEVTATFSTFLAEAEAGEEIVITRAGTAIARLSAVTPSDPARRRLGFLRGQTTVPDDFDTWAQDEIRAMFEDSE